MLNINDLERRWLKYKIKSYIPHLIILISFIVILILLFIVLNIKPVIKQAPVIEPMPKKVELKSKVTAVIHEKPDDKKSETEINNNKVVLSPSLNFMNNMQESTTPKYKTQVTSKVQPQKIKTTEIERPVKQESKKSITVEPQQKIKPIKIKQESSISIVRQTSQNEINEVVKRFNKNNNPALSLFIAKKYYELGEYRKAYNYALKTNNINNDIEASWIIFAKSLVKLNEKDMAVKTLSKYVKHSSSNRARVLLNNIVLGKFK